MSQYRLVLVPVLALVALSSCGGTVMGIVSVELDEHPPANIQQGEQFAAQVTEAILDSPNWPRTALFITYDEHGGFYDHVPPPAACPPDDIAQLLDPSDPSSDFPAQLQ